MRVRSAERSASGDCGVPVRRAEGLARLWEELAGWTGSSREAAVKALRTLRELGWIATRRGGVTVLDVDALRRRAL